MRRPRSDGVETRQRLLEAAVEVFAEKGFWEATTAEICRKAEANSAAVNYHFGSKEDLYVESWRHAFEQSIEAYPPGGGVPDDAPAKERLRGRILSVLRRIIDPKSHAFDMVHKEMANPTGLLTGVVRESIEPMRQEFAAIVRELLGEGATDEQVRLCQMSVKAQCFGPMLHERRRQKAGKEPPLPGPEMLEPDVEALADHIVRFSLAGIRDVRRRGAKSGRRKQPAKGATRS
ncbi:MAG: CerR family C-terminal domain-containing protein [Planctomycetota bacterium]